MKKLLLLLGCIAFSLGFSTEPAFVTYMMTQFDFPKIAAPTDINKDGTISAKEIATLNSQLVDLNKDGFISRCEFVTGTKSIFGSRLAELMYDFDTSNGFLFVNAANMTTFPKQMDLNQDGIFTMAELETVISTGIRQSLLALYNTINGPDDIKRNEFNLNNKFLLPAYKAADLNKDGLISPREFFLSLSKKSLTRCGFVDANINAVTQVLGAGAGPTEWILSRMFTEVDVNQDGVWDLKDGIITAHQADTNGDGKVTVKEIASWDFKHYRMALWSAGIPHVYLNDLCPNYHIPYRGVNVLLAAADYDYDKDGLITTQEMAKHFHEQWDRNWDGVLDYEEYEYKVVTRYGGSKQQATLQYKYFDFNKDGVVTLEDFTFVRWDKNKNGVLELCEEVMSDIQAVSSLTWSQIHGKQTQKGSRALV